MKRNLLILSFLLFSIAQANCQKEKPIRITEPEFSGNTVFVNDSIGSGVLLEQQTATLGNAENNKRSWKFSQPEIVEFKAKKFGTSSYLITVPKFSIGQYGIYFKNTYTVNLFAVKIVKQ